MPHSEPSNNLPPAALSEFTKIAKADWEGGVPLTELLERVNRLAVGFRPEKSAESGEDERRSRSGRVRLEFSERSFRHYQTERCIEPPEKRGRRAGYGFRHFLQALLVRKLLWERIPAEQIASMLRGRGTDELQRMLLGGVEIVAREQSDDDAEQGQGFSGRMNWSEVWERIRVEQGIELHLSSGRKQLTPSQIQVLLERFYEILRQHGK